VSGSVARFVDMEMRERIAELSDEEMSEICSAATWYAKFHARIIAERADDPSAMAVAQRDHYLSLIAGLRKLGVRVVDPTAAVTSLIPARTAENGADADAQQAA
jgi:hypothetical protein